VADQVLLLLDAVRGPEAPQLLQVQPRRRVGLLNRVIDAKKYADEGVGPVEEKLREVACVSDRTFGHVMLREWFLFLRVDQTLFLVIHEFAVE